jgi:hypothetical protein
MPCAECGYRSCEDHGCIHCCDCGFELKPVEAHHEAHREAHPELGDPIANLLDLIGVSIADDVERYDVTADGVMLVEREGRTYLVHVEDVTIGLDRQNA